MWKIKSQELWSILIVFPAAAAVAVDISPANGSILAGDGRRYGGAAGIVF